MKRFAIILMAVIMVMTYIPVTAGIAFAEEDPALEYSVEVTELPLYVTGDKIKITIRGGNLADYINDTGFDGETVMIPYGLVKTRAGNSIELLKDNIDYIDPVDEESSERIPDFSFKSLIKTSFKPNEDGSLTHTATLKTTGTCDISLGYGSFNATNPKKNGGQFVTLRYNGTNGRWELLDQNGNAETAYNKMKIYKPIYYGFETISFSVQNWRPGEEKTITFNANKGTCDTKSKVVTNGKKYGTLPKASRDGYFFKGWYTTKTGGKRVFSTTEVQLPKDKTLYAHWSSTYTDKIKETTTKKIAAGKTCEFEFSIDNSEYLLMPWNLKTTSGKKVTSGGMTISLENKNGTSYGTMEYNLKGDKVWFGHFRTLKKIKHGDYIIKVTNTSNKKLSLDSYINGYYGYALKATMKAKASGPRDDLIKIGTLKKGFPEIKKFYSSKKSVVKDYVVDYDGSIYVLGLEKGTSNITITLKNGTKYKTAVTFKEALPHFDAGFTVAGKDSSGYYVKIKIVNNGLRDLKIKRKGGYLYNNLTNSSDFEYIKDTSSVTIRAGKTKTIKIHVDEDMGDAFGDSGYYGFKAWFTYEGITYDWMLDVENGSYYESKGEYYFTN